MAPDAYNRPYTFIWAQHPCEDKYWRCNELFLQLVQGFKLLVGPFLVDVGQVFSLFSAERGRDPS